MFACFQSTFLIDANIIIVTIEIKCQTFKNANNDNNIRVSNDFNNTKIAIIILEPVEF